MQTTSGAHRAADARAKRPAVGDGSRSRRRGPGGDRGAARPRALSDLPQFAGKGFGARLVAYPLLMLLLPAMLLVRRARGSGVEPVQWTAVALVMTPFLIDVTGNTLDLYDSLSWWDDANHFSNWALLCGGLGLLLPGAVTSRAALVGLVTGLGSVLAVLWEVGEWWTFIRHGTELATAYEDTLGDEVLGTLGALVAGLLLARLAWPPAAAPRRGGP